MTIRSPKRKLNHFTNQQALFIVLVNQTNLIPLLIRQNRKFRHRLKNEGWLVWIHELMLQLKIKNENVNVQFLNQSWHPCVFSRHRSVCVFGEGASKASLPQIRQCNKSLSVRLYSVCFSAQEHWVELPFFQFIGLAIIAFLGFGADSVRWSDSVNQTKRCQMYDVTWLVRVSKHSTSS